MPVPDHFNQQTVITKSDIQLGEITIFKSVVGYIRHIDTPDGKEGYLFHNNMVSADVTSLLRFGPIDTFFTFVNTLQS